MDIKEFVNKVDIITYEFENIPYEAYYKFRQQISISKITC